MVSLDLASQSEVHTTSEMIVKTKTLKWCAVPLSDVVARGKRLEASVFDVEAKRARQIIQSGKYPLTTIGGQNGRTTSYTCARFKRIWVERSELPIYQPSTIVDVKPSPDRYISKLTQTNIDALKVHRGQVLMTCSGTIGKVSYVSNTLEDKLFSHDLLRVNCKEIIDQGYIYAYLKSDLGNKMLLTNSYGAVITHIEPEHLATVPIPDAPKAVKERIHNLIVQSYSLRDESNNMIDQATQLLIDELHLPDIHDFDVKDYKKNAPIETYSVKLSDMNGRADASFHVPLVAAIVDHLRKSAKEVIAVGDKRISSAIILPGRFKRVYVDHGYGIPFFGGRNIGELDPSDKKYLSLARHGKKIKEELIIHEGMVLVTCSGTIGKIALVPKHWDGWAMTHDIIRLVPVENIQGYVYIWLRSNYAEAMIRAQAYGSVVTHIEKEHLSNIPLPILRNQRLQMKINDLALSANGKRYEAYRLEQQALHIMDTEVIYAK